jgi:hypothetical protein
MENDRDRNDWPQDDQAGGNHEPDSPGAGGPDEAEPRASDDGGEQSASSAEIESWPSQEHADTPPEEPRWPADEAPRPAADESWRSDEPPPSEVEAYPVPPPAGEEHAAAAPDAAPAHAVPAAESTTGESTQCPRCGTENRPGLSFCRNCGQRLMAAGVATTVERPGTPEGTTACARCGTHNRAGVAFCQNCGANLRGAAPGYVPPAAAGEPAPAAARRQGGAILGPVVLLIGVIGLVTGYLLPFAYGPGSLLDRAIGAGGWGIAFWDGYPEVGAALVDQVYFGLAAPVPLLGLLLVGLAIAGFVRAAPGLLQTIGLVVALLWALALIVLFVIVELAGNWGGDLVGLLRVLTPAGIIFLLSGLIITIGVLTRFGRS